ncbi:MAG: amidohydrolase family protein [Methanobacteriaceae archaeon]|jgi:imidazolonepropionase-like amidohydrolase|nr:amidohydrolase family protein [Methanobacteriaceae archaeon]OPY23814.1 MAG: imidazolonepropionase [Methanobacterium sp. PtaU1.Bin097]
MTYFLIHNGTLIDGTGKPPVNDAAILIRDDVIEYVGPEDPLKLPGVKIRKVDADGGFLLPGFIDSHLHLMANGFHMEDTMYNPLSLFFYKGVENMRRTVNAGVTTVRDGGLADYGVKMAVEKGLITGPRMQISVTPLSITGGHFDFWLKSGFDMKISYPGFPDSICDGVENVRRKVREIMRAGAEVIKVMATGGVISANDSPEHPQFSKEEFKVIIDEARTRGLKTMAHAHGTEGIKNAVEAGIDSVEHGTYLDREAIDMILEREVYLVPTLITQQFNKIAAESGSIPEYGVDDAIRIADIHKKNMEKAYKAGVTLLMGTDCGVIEHGVNLQELGFLCEIGMTPMEAIMSGTKIAAERLGWQDKIGTLEAGKLADIVISKTDPLSDINSLGNPNNIRMVLKEGKIIKDFL